MALAEKTSIDLRADDGTQRVLLDREDVTTAIRTPEVAQAASKIAVNAGVRHVLVAEQRRAGVRGGVVMEGRDIGSVVFPDAQLKIFLTASPETRAERRWREHQQKGDAIDLQKTLEEILERDRRDKERTTSPLVRARRRGGGGQHRDGARRSRATGGAAGQGRRGPGDDELARQMVGRRGAARRVRFQIPRDSDCSSANQQRTFRPVDRVEVDAVTGGFRRST